MTPCIWRISSFRSFWCATNELFAIHKIIHDQSHGQIRLILLPLSPIIDFICRFAKLLGGASDHAPILNTEGVMRSRKLRRQVVLLRETARLIRLLVQRKTPIGTLTTPLFERTVSHYARTWAAYGFQSHTSRSWSASLPCQARSMNHFPISWPSAANNDSLLRLGKRHRASIFLLLLLVNIIVIFR